MPDFVLSDAMAKELRDLTRRFRSYPWNTDLSQASSPAFDVPEPPVLVQNTSNENVPPFGIMAVADAFMVGNEPITKIAKPSTTFTRLYLVNGPAPLYQNAVGPAQRGPIVKVAYDSGTPAAGDGWGPKAAQWTVTKNYPAAISIHGVADSTNKYAVGRLGPINSVIGELHADISSGSNVQVDIWGGAGNSEAAITSLHIQGYDWVGQAQSSGTKVFCQWIDGIWYILAGGAAAEPCAEDCDFHLSGTLATSNATATAVVDAYHNGPSPTGTVTIANMAASSNYIFSGANGHKGWATLTSYSSGSGNATYTIRQMECT